MEDKITQFVQVVENEEGIQTVNARELHGFLEVGKKFADWIKDKIKKYKFIENDDYIVWAKKGNNPKGGRPLDEYHISVDMAMQLSMVQNNEKGSEARNYFIACEKELKKITLTQKPLSEAEITSQALVIAHRTLAARRIESERLSVELASIGMSNHKNRVMCGSERKPKYVLVAN